jgi:hypothetical protein
MKTIGIARGTARNPNAGYVRVTGSVITYAWQVRVVMRVCACCDACMRVRTRGRVRMRNAYVKRAESLVSVRDASIERSS